MPLTKVERFDNPWLEDIRGRHLVFAIGYEERSRFIISQVQNSGQRNLGLRFGDNEVHDFQVNLAWSESIENIQIGMADNEMIARATFRGWLGSIKRDGDCQTKIAVDVSSLSRLHIAVVISELSLSDMNIDAAFVYTPSTFTQEGFGEGSFTQFGAVTQDFAGISDVTKYRLAVVIALGYEKELALATQQFLDPKESWMMLPVGFNEKYDRAVRSANDEVIRLSEGNVIEYDLTKPFDGFVALESLVSGLVRDSNVVLVPFGPKLFAVIMMLVGLIHLPDVGVWRVSAERYLIAKNKVASGEVFGISAIFDKKSERRDLQ